MFLGHSKQHLTVMYLQVAKVLGILCNSGFHV